jgi:hypothetical protein
MTWRMSCSGPGGRGRGCPPHQGLHRAKEQRAPTSNVSTAITVPSAEPATETPYMLHTRRTALARPRHRRSTRNDQWWPPRCPTHTTQERRGKRKRKKEGGGGKRGRRRRRLQRPGTTIHPGAWGAHELSGDSTAGDSAIQIFCCKSCYGVTLQHIVLKSYARQQKHTGSEGDSPSFLLQHHSPSRQTV